MACRVKKHVLESSVARLEKFRLYETSTMYYLVGFNALETSFRLLKLNRTIVNPKQLSEIVREDPLIYSASDISDVLDMIHEGNKTSGGLVKVCTACGVVGFVKFLNGYYLTLVTQKKEVGCIAGNFIYTIKATEMFPIRPKPVQESNALKSLWKSLNKRISQTTSEIAENRYVGLFQFIDMTKDFFFSYSYDLTHSLQHNFVAAKNDNVPPPLEMFEWNYYQTCEFRSIVGIVSASQWTLPIVHGSFQQKRFSQLGTTMDLILMARRSRHYAGTRYLKRGLNVSGKVANDCEVEQILQYDEGADLKFCAYVQMRGSIPTYWHQETSVTMPKPPILINRIDPDYLATQEHFSDMFRRYGSPIIVLDLVKQHERRPRESLVGREFRTAIETLNECIVMKHKIRYVALDYSKITSISKGKFTKAKTSKQGGFLGLGKAAGEKERATAAVGDEWNLMEKSVKGTDTPQKSRTGEAQTLTKFDDSKLVASPASFGTVATGKTALDVLDDVTAVESRIDVLKELEDVASLSIQETGFFCNSIQFPDRMEHVLDPVMVASAERNNILTQSGVLRTNCIDCLDRTNGGQFAVGLYFLRIALYTLGLRSQYSKNVEIHKDPMLLMLMEMYGEMADKIALQYGGSEAHKKVLAGKAVATNNSKQNELLTSIKRYYSNAFTDMVKQDAMNIFLGCFVPSESSIPLWDLESDYHLHNLTLHPPRPAIQRLLFEEIFADATKLKEGRLRSKLDVLLKKVMQKVIALSAASQDKSATKDEDIVVDGIKLSVADCERLLRRYYMRFVAQTSLTQEMHLASASAESPKALPIPPLAAPAQSPQPQAASSPTAPAASAAPPAAAVARPARSKKRKNMIATTVSALTRLERRRLLRCIVAAKVARSSQFWWQTAIHEFNYANSIRDFTGSSHDHEVDLDPATEAELDEQLSKSHNIYSDAQPDDLLPAETYFDRYYRPHQLTEFDDLLSMDFFSVTELSHDRMLGQSRSGEGSAAGKSTAALASDASILSNILYYPNLLTSAVVGHNSNSEVMEDAEIAEGLAELSQINQATRDTFLTDPNNPITAATNATGRSLHGAGAGPGPGSSVAGGSGGGGGFRPGAVSKLLIEDDDYSGTTAVNPSPSTATPSNNISTLGRYVREIGLKARTLVGGFLRKDDAGSGAAGVVKRVESSADALNKYSQMSAITSLHSTVSKSSLLLYNNYAAAFADNTLLLYDRFAPHPMDSARKTTAGTVSGQSHVLYDVAAVRDEYKTLLKDHNIHIDDVVGMEWLSRDSYVSRDVNRGIFAGLPQNYSAQLAYLFLFLSLEFMNAELFSFGNVIDLQYNLFRFNKEFGALGGHRDAQEKSHASHSRVFQSNLHSSAVYGVNLATAATASADGTYSLNSLNSLDFSQRRDMIAKKLSVEVTSKLQDRVKDCISRQNAVRNANFRNHLCFPAATPWSIAGGGSGGGDGQHPVGGAGAGNGSYVGVGQATPSYDVIAQGLENELRKVVNNHIFQQYTYSKEISIDRLSLRISSHTTDPNLQLYINQFDYDYLAADFESVQYILKDSSNYRSFREIAQLQRRLDGTIKQIAEKKRALLASRSGGCDGDQPTGTSRSKAQSPEDSLAPRDPSPEKDTSILNRRQSYRKVRKDQVVKERVNRIARKAVPTRSHSVYTTKYGPPGAMKSISSQLGIYNAILEEDLRTDFSLQLYSDAKPSPSSTYASAAGAGASGEAMCPSYPFANFPYNQESYRIVDHDYAGFVQLAPDLYSRSTNPHLLLNEIGVMRFKDSLKRQELAVLDDLTVY